MNSLVFLLSFLTDVLMEWHLEGCFHVRNVKEVNLFTGLL